MWNLQLTSAQCGIKILLQVQADPSVPKMQNKGDKLHAWFKAYGANSQMKARGWYQIKKRIELSHILVHLIHLSLAQGKTISG